MKIPPMKIPKNVAGWAIFIVLCISCSVLIWAIWLAYIPVNPIDIKEPLQLTTPEPIYPGDLIQVKLEYDKHVNVPASITIQLVNNVTLTLTDGDKHLNESTLPPGKGVIYPVGLLPKELPSGMYFVRVTLAYQVNPLQKVSKSFNSSYFRVHQSPNTLTVEKLSKKVAEMEKVQEALNRRSIVHSSTSQENNEYIREVKGMVLQMRYLLENQEVVLKNQGDILRRLETIERQHK